MTERSEVKRAFLRLVVDAASWNRVLDSEDREMLVKFHMGEITKDQFDAFTAAKAQRLQEQIDRPQ